MPSKLLITPETTYICVCTYQRNDLLRELLRSLRAQQLSGPEVSTIGPAQHASSCLEGTGTEETGAEKTAAEGTGTETQIQAPGMAGYAARPLLIVVDNAPEASAADVVSAEYPGAQYVHEPRPGIAVARNAALEALPSDATAVAFIDDDERADPDWLRALVDCANHSGADTVSGPVMSMFPEGAPADLDASGYIRRTDFPTGPWTYRPATNNVLVRSSWFLEPNGFRFDEAFNLTGGEDSDLFERMQAAGARSWWCAEAVVSEDVPWERTTRAWMRQRGIRAGHVRALKLAKRGARPWRIGAETLARAAAGTARVAGRRARGRRVRYIDSAYLTEALGMWQSLRGRAEDEYRR